MNKKIYSRAEIEQRATIPGNIELAYDEDWYVDMASMIQQLLRDLDRAKLSLQVIKNTDDLFRKEGLEVIAILGLEFLETK
jgi:hypothetical protein